MNFYREWKRFYIDFSVGRHEEIPAEWLAAWDRAAADPAAFIASLHAQAIPDDPEAHAVVSGQSALDDPGYVYDSRPIRNAYFDGPPPAPAHEWVTAHIGAQTATVTVEPLNMVNQRDEE